MVKVIRWVCRRCNKKWIYPIEKCIYCMGPIEKEIGTKTRIVGLSKVNVPNPYHPIVPYNVLLLEDEHGSRMPKKTVKDYKVGDIYEDKPSASEHAVSIIKIKYDIYEAVKESLELIGDVNIKGSTKILIKPTIIGKAYPYQAINTNPKMLDALIKVLLDKGAKPENIVVGEQNLFSPMEAALPRSKLGDICKENKVKFADLEKGGFVEKEADDFKLKISKEVFDKDLIINVPVMKTHMLLGISGALENMTHVVSKEDFDELKDEPMKALQAMVSLQKVLPKYLTVADATIGMQGNNPMHGEPGFYNMILASKDPVALDKVFQEMNLLRRADYVETAGKLGIGEADIEKIDVVGNELRAVQKDVKQPIGSKLFKLKKDG
ncbi:DUF362 domain-containing protein [Candidatus Woesearchaeota archaeon]|nr:DUF362 domain-containing protein [Candidatus Woesearchaeota archaeon]